MFVDITEKWIDNEATGSYKYKNEVDVGGRLFRVGENGVSQEHDEREIEVAKILAEKYGFIVELMPEITGKEEQQHIQMPDFILNGIPYEYKRIYGTGKNTFMHSAKNGEKQSHNLIFDISYNKEKQEELIEKSKLLYINKNTRFVEIIVIICGEDIIKVFRKKEDPHPDNKM